MAVSASLADYFITVNRTVRSQSFTNRFTAGVLILERYISITDSQVAIKDDDITILDVTVRRRPKSFGPPTHSQKSSTNFLASGYFL